MGHEQGGLTLQDTDAIRLKVNGALEPDRKIALGQFMTPSVIADFMASLFSPSISPACLMDAGAGIGSLTIAAARRLANLESVDAWEIDPLMLGHLEVNLKNLGVKHRVVAADFIESAVRQVARSSCGRYTHAILNPPYKKLNSTSLHRTLLRKVGIETVNLYTAFVALCVLLMQDQGQVVAIIPRSFCNGPYYRPFRELLLNTCSLERIHVFEARNRAFKDDDVLQENVIIKLVKGKKQGDIVVSTSHDQQLTDYSERTWPFGEIVKPADLESFIHVPTEEHDKREETSLFQHSLEEIGLDVSTGPVVDFRLKDYWLENPAPGSIPLLYPHHFSSGKLQYPKRHKKPNALRNGEEVQKWLMPNDCYVIVKRFSSKEERRRVVAYVVSPEDIKCSQVGFENHWNVFHHHRRGIDPALARGLACFLNSTVLDKHFRVFSGHTQVNATDLKNMKYPDTESLKALGEGFRGDMTQAEIDSLVRQTNEQRN
ncbi:MAG: Eco57I restriction-modification methylase domain-containing protein [Terracidiphilus sp.]